MTIKEFYHSHMWQTCATAYRKKAGGICERCYEQGIITPGVEVHHKIHLTPQNVTDQRIATNFDNLMLLCPACHEAMHKKFSHRFCVDPITGKVTSPNEGNRKAKKNTSCAHKKNWE